jgi:hypothetical protein
MNKQNKRPFNMVSEEEFVAVWNISRSKEEVKRRLNISNFGTKDQRLNYLLEKYNLPRLGYKKVEELTSLEISQGLNKPGVTTLRELCIALNLPRKEANAALKKRIIEGKFIVPKHLNKAIFGVSSTPWTRFSAETILFKKK